MGETCGSGCGCGSEVTKTAVTGTASAFGRTHDHSRDHGRAPDHHHAPHSHAGGCEEHGGYGHGETCHHDHLHEHGAPLKRTEEPAGVTAFQALPVLGAQASCSDAACGCHGNPVFDGMDRRYRTILWVVIAINAVMFVVEMIAGRLAGSQALQADALDFLGDTLTYGMSLAVIGMSLKVRATAALLKGVSLFAMGLWVFGATAYQVLVLGVPDAPVMGIIGLMALAANVASVLLLMRYKDGDANVRSVWLCSRNDAIGNIAVMGAAGAVAFTASAWPDLIVAALMAGLFLNSSVSILRQAWAERTSSADPVTGQEAARPSLPA